MIGTALSPPFVAVPATGARERLAAVLAAFIVTLESPCTRRAYRGDWSRYTAFLRTSGVEPLAATTLHVAGYFEHLRARNLARSTRARALSVLREMYAAACRAELIHFNPAREIKLPRAHREPNTPWLTEQQIVALLSGPTTTWTESRDRLVLLILVGLGLRRASVARLCVDSLVRAPDGRLAVRVLAKGAKQATLLLPLWLASEIEKWITFSGVTGPLFPRSRRVGYDDVRPEYDRTIGPSKVYEIVKAAAKRVGIADHLATPHALRRSLVSHARSRGATLEELQATLMHSKITTTESYDHAERAMRSAPGDRLADLYTAAAAASAGDARRL